MAVVFLKVGQDVHFEGGSVEDAVNGRSKTRIYRRLPEKICGRRSFIACKYKR